MTNLEAIKILDNLKPGDYSNPYEKGEAIVMAISALQEQEEKTQLSAEGTTSDLISRQAAIDRIVWWFGILKQNPDILIDSIKTLPSAHSEIEKRKEESAQNVPKEDLISRKAAIDAIVDCTVYGNADELEEAVMQGNDWNRWSGGVLEALEAVKDLPSAQPEPLVKESRTLVKDLVKDTISRQAAIDALVKAIRKDPYYDTIMRAERRADDLQ